VGNTHLYQATSQRQVTLGDVVRKFIDSTFGGSADALVMTLLADGGVTPDEARRIRKRIDEAAKRSR
jgi:predicted transcriptional regulator